MTFALPPLKQTPSPNWSERVPATIDLVVIHDCEGDYLGSISWFSQVKSRVSAHLVLNDDGSECTQMVPLLKKAWHAVDFNSRSIGVEMSGFVAKGFTPGELNADANIVAWLLKRFDIPCQDAHGGARPGFTSHFALGARGGGHVDPTTNPVIWAGYVARVCAAYASLPDSLPAWAFDNALPRLVKLTLPEPAPEGFVSTTDGRDDDIVLPVWGPITSPFFVLAARVMNKWLSLGVSETVALGLVANAEAESAFDVAAVGDHDRAFGLYQWWTNRVLAILANAKIDVRTDPLIEHHVEAAWWELNNTYVQVWTEILNAQTANEAAQAICTLYEGASALNAAIRRGAMADRWAAFFAANPAILTDNPAQG